MFTIILFVYFNNIFTHKNGFVSPYQEIDDDEDDDDELFLWYGWSTKGV